MEWNIAFVNCFCVVLIISQLSLAANGESVTVDTDVGKFVGYIRRFKAFGQTLAVKRFLGIPYAEQPIRDLRFQKPEPKSKLETPFDATEYGPSCIQQRVNLGGKRKPGIMESLKYSEDCLFLNIYTPAGVDQTKELLPVMIYIHGGAYVFGSPQLYPQDILSAYGNVVAVTIAYRLSIWGFLSTGDKELPGNYGLWDQQLAIQWVQDNIEKFGGDPHSVTIYGSSAGGSSVVYQGLYPGNQGLVHKVSAQSGSVTCGFAFNKDPVSAAKRIASLVGCNDHRSTRQIAECLKAKSSDELWEALEVNKKMFQAFTYQFVPVLDGDFILDNPASIFHGRTTSADAYRKALGDLDLMVGVNSGEGLITFAPIYDVQKAEEFRVTRQKFESELVPKVVRTVFSKNAPTILNDIIIGEYTNWTDPDSHVQSRESYIKLSSDYKYNIKAIETAQVHADSSDRNTFVYLYDAMPSQHHFPVPDWADQPTHLDEMTSLLGYDVEDGYTSWTTPYSEEPPADWELEMSKAMIIMWTNFARTGNPNEPANIQTYTRNVWPEYDTESQHYFRISRQMSENSVGQRLFARETNFWRNVLPGVINAVERGQKQQENDDRGHCERDKVCEP